MEVETEGSEDVDCNSLVSHEYSDKTRNSMKQISEKSLSFELIESLIKYIVTLNQPGGILIFLPGWNLICSLLKYLRDNPFLGSSKFILLPLHSQIPREDQYKGSLKNFSISVSFKYFIKTFCLLIISFRGCSLWKNKNNCEHQYCRVKYNN